MASKRSRELAKTGFELMDKKRNILVREIMSLIDKAAELQSQIDSVFSEAYQALSIANITLGKCNRIAEAVEPDKSVSIRYRSVMGVEIPSISTAEPKLSLPYGFIGTNSALDEAYIKFHRVKKLILDLAETENTIYRLAYNIKKTQKRANALENIVIPNFDNTIRSISDTLEEKEREEFVRLKVLKEKTRADE